MNTIKLRNNVGGLSALIMIVLFIGVGLLLGPALLIWSLNTLFGTTIGWTFQNWLASIVLLIITNASASRE